MSSKEEIFVFVGGGPLIEDLIKGEPPNAPVLNLTEKSKIYLIEADEEICKKASLNIKDNNIEIINEAVYSHNGTHYFKSQPNFKSRMDYAGDRLVKISRLDKVLFDYNIPNFHYLYIHTNGGEEYVWNGIMLNKYTPKGIMIPNKPELQSIYDELIERGFIDFTEGSEIKEMKVFKKGG